MLHRNQETERQTSSQCQGLVWIHMSGSVWIWELEANTLFPAAPLTLRHSGTTVWESEMFENVCPHLCELTRAVPQHPSWDIVWACCFLGVDVLLTSSADAARGRWPVVFPAIPKSLNLPATPLSSDLIVALGFESWSNCEKLYPTAFLCYLPCYYRAPSRRQKCLND